MDEIYTLKRAYPKSGTQDQVIWYAQDPIPRTHLRGGTETRDTKDEIWDPRSRSLKWDLSSWPFSKVESEIQNNHLNQSKTIPFLLICCLFPRRRIYFSDLNFYELFSSSIRPIVHCQIKFICSFALITKTFFQFVFFCPSCDVKEVKYLQFPYGDELFLWHFVS